MSRNYLTTVALGGAVAGLLDIGMAAAINLVGLDVIMRAIARGLLGQPAMTGGLQAALIGLVLQVAMGVLIALVYGLAALRLPALLRRWLSFGLAYGVGVFLVMNWVVGPLSAVHRVPKFDLLHGALNLAAMLVFGVIVAYAAHRGAAGKTAPAVGSGAH